MIESIFKFLTEIAICFSKCWKFSFFLYSFKRTFFSFRFFEKFFFSNYAKKKWKNDFVIFRTLLQNSSFKTLTNFTKKNHSKIFFVSQCSIQIFDFIATFFFSIFKMQHFFFHWFLKLNRFFNIFSFFETCRRARFSL